MAVRNEIAFAERNPSRWHRLMTRLATFEQATTFNPHDLTDANDSHLWHKVEKLETRVNELEGRDPRIA